MYLKIIKQYLNEVRAKQLIPVLQNSDVMNKTKGIISSFIQCHTF